MSFDENTNEILVYGCSFSPAIDIGVDPSIREAFIAGRCGYDDVSKIKDIWEDDSRWEIYRDRSLKPSQCSSCSSFGKTCAGTGYCHIQNHKYGQLSVQENIIEQIKTQMTELPNWCEHVQERKIP